MGLLNALPLPAGVDFTTHVGSQVQEIVTTYNIERLEAVTGPADLDLQWASQGTKVTPGIGLVKVPVKFLSSQQFTNFKIGGQRDYSAIDIAAIQINTSPKQLNYRWAMLMDQLGKLVLQSLKGDGTYEEFYGAAGLAAAFVAAGHAHKAAQVATVVYESMTDTTSGIAATLLGIPENGSPNGLPLFSNGTDSAKHLANPFNGAGASFENLFRPGITNRVGFTGGAFDVVWLEKMVAAMRSVPHPSLPNSTLGLPVTDVVGPTWMQVPFWRAAVAQLVLQTATIGGNGVAGAPTNIFNAKLLEEMGASALIGASGMAPQRYWTSSYLDNHPYFTNNSNANMTTGPGGGPAHMALAICAQKPTQVWCELAARDSDFTPLVYMYGPGDPQAQSERMVRMLGDLDAGAKPGLPHFAAMFLGV